MLDGKTPRISATNTDNGILDYYKDIDDKNYRVFENFISVSFLGTVFYHKCKASLDMKIHCLKLKNKELNREVAFYLTSIIRQALKNIEEWINNYPRKIFNFKTAEEMFRKEVSTIP